MNTNDFMQFLNLILSPITTFGSVIAAILAWIAKIKWSQEYGQAKEETIKQLHEQINSKQEQINTKNTQIEVKESQIAKLESMNSIYVEEYYSKQKTILEKIIKDLNNTIDDLNHEIKTTKEALTQAEDKKNKALPTNQDNGFTNELVEKIAFLNEELSKETQKREQIETYNKELQDSLGEKSFTNFGGAVEGIEHFSRAFLDECLQNGKPLNIKYELLAVAMTFSWEFIHKTLPSILDAYPMARVELNLLFVDPDYLDGLDLPEYPVNWAEISRKRITEIMEFAVQAQKYQGRLTFSARTYQNLPHWHGWLINNTHLFLGRTDWNISGSKPALTVGQNKYRYFDKDKPEGLERISLFQDWHTYYSYFAPKSTVVYSSDDSDI